AYISGLNKDEWAFVVSVYYGRKAMVLVETNLDREIASKAVEEALYNGSAISPETRKILQQCTIRASTYGKAANEASHDDDPLTHVYNYLQSPVTPKDFEEPLYMIMFELKNYATLENNF
ncbi:hypothetical protein M8994_20560, partial [Brucella sp. 21LCYQ03]|nr:hypothetical protein [Brucella sp. 21LCYQ03]